MIMSTATASVRIMIVARVTTAASSEVIEMIVDTEVRLADDRSLTHRRRHRHRYLDRSRT